MPLSYPLSIDAIVKTAYARSYALLPVLLIVRYVHSPLLFFRANI